MSFSKYLTFGLREVWLEGFLSDPVVWLRENTLGPEQLKAFRRYLKDAEFLDINGNPTALTLEMSELYTGDRNAVWQIVWLNLYLNSPLFNFYCSEVPWKSVWNKEDLVYLIKEKGYAERTARNAVNALVNTFENSPLGSWFGRKLEKSKYLKEGIRSLSPFALKYALGKVGEKAELFERIFGMNIQDFHYNLMRIKI